jgi:hypothetical protein
MIIIGTSMCSLRRLGYLNITLPLLLFYPSLLQVTNNIN